jgi:hypothetical protein
VAAAVTGQFRPDGETIMSNIILYTTDEHSANGIREASFQEVLDAARLALAKRVRRGTGFTSPRVTADFLRVRLGSSRTPAPKRCDF